MTFVAVAVLLLLTASAFTSGTETAITSLERSRVRQLAEQGDWRARLLDRLIADRERLIGALLVGNNIFNILAASLATDILITATGHVGVVYATITMTVLVVIFSEILPKTYALRHNERFALLTAPAAKALVIVLWPLALAASWIVGHLLRLLSRGQPDAPRENSAERLRGTLKFMGTQGGLKKDDRDMLSGILDLERVEVGQIMTHRRKIFSIDVETRPGQFADQLRDVPFSRIPVHEGAPDQIIGIVTIRDLFERRTELAAMTDMRSLIKKPWFVPETRPIRSQLEAFRRKRAHLAFVVDEYGDLQGLITLEDIIEEIVGEIVDESDPSVVEFNIDDQGRIIADAAMAVRDLNRQHDWSLPEQDASTLGGLVTHHAEKIPGPGEQIDIHGYRFTVIDHRGNWLERLQVERLDPIERDRDRPRADDAGQN